MHVCDCMTVCMSVCARERLRHRGRERGGGLGVRERLSHFLVAFPSDLGSTNFLLSLRRQPKLFDDEEQQQDEGTKKISHSLREILCVETRWERETLAPAWTNHTKIKGCS